MGPVFGAKGGGVGRAARSEAVPPAELNLHLTGDFHAVAAANNLLAAAIDSALLHGVPAGIVPECRCHWPGAVVVVNDRALRLVGALGLGRVWRTARPRASRGFGHHAGVGGGWCVLGLARDPCGPAPLRLARIVIGSTGDGRFVTAGVLGTSRGSMAALLGGGPRSDARA
jgi:formate--tetrahydrofolate ligase